MIKTDNIKKMRKKVMTIPLQASRYMQELTNEQAGRLLRAMFDYHEGMPVAVDNDIKGVWQTLECIFLIQEEEAEEQRRCASWQSECGKTTKTTKTT